MKKVALYILFLITINLYPQEDSAFAKGEFLKFRIHYGFVNAGYATLEVKEDNNAFHLVGRGFTTGVFNFFFSIEDIYESYVDKKSGNPYRFVRKINEGGYIKNQEGFFNIPENKIIFKDYKNKTEDTFEIAKNTQDLLSAFYYLRNYPEISKLKPNESVIIDIFFDKETTKFKLKFVKKEDIITKFGIFPAMVFKPIMQTGRVFKEQESITIWISDDNNRIPLRIKASLVVGSINADLETVKGLKNPIKTKKQ